MSLRWSGSTCSGTKRRPVWCRAKQRHNAHRARASLLVGGSFCQQKGRSTVGWESGDRTPDHRYQLAGPLRRRLGLATRWNAVMTAGISTGDKVITNITTRRSIVLPTYLPSAKRIAASAFWGTRYAARLSPCRGGDSVRAVRRGVGSVTDGPPVRLARSVHRGVQRPASEDPPDCPECDQLNTGDIHMFFSVTTTERSVGAPNRRPIIRCATHGSGTHLITAHRGVVA